MIFFRGKLRRRTLIGVIIGIGFFFIVLQLVFTFSQSTFDVENLKFIKEPCLNSFNEIEFSINCDKEHLFFRISGVAATGSGPVSSFCDEENVCLIPNVIAGNINFVLEYHERIGNDLSTFFFSGRKHEIANLMFTAKDGQINCTNEPWTNRRCTFKKICYSCYSVETNAMGNIYGNAAVERYTLITPYKVDIDEELLVLGAKTPPVDLEPMRMIGKVNSTIDGSPVARSLKSERKISSESYLVGIYYNMGMLWHQYFDFLLPLYQTMKLKSGYIDPRYVIAYPSYAPQIPLLTNVLTKSLPIPVVGNMCFDKLTMGMVKVTDLSQDAEDPPYKFCKNCSYGLRELVLRNIGKIKSKESAGDYQEKERADKVMANSDKPLAIILGRISSTRSLNERQVKKALKKILPNFEVQIFHFEDIPLSRQIELVSRASLFVAVHGSGLSHVLWLKPGSYMIEIMPYKFNCNDWYAKAAGAAGVNYMAYYCDGDSERPEELSERFNQCMGQKDRCMGKKCKDSLRDQNVTVDPHRFVSYTSEFLKGLQ